MASIYSTGRLSGAGVFSPGVYTVALTDSEKIDYIYNLLQNGLLISTNWAHPEALTVAKFLGLK